MTEMLIAKPIAIGRNIILYGPPGTGKTYRTAAIAVNQIDGTHSTDRTFIKKRYDELVASDRISFVTFHPSFSYEEFVQGIVAETSNNTISYSVRDGVFKSFCEKARANPSEHYVFIIDELNRGNIARIFGELITLLEPTKRAGSAEALSVTLPYSTDDEAEFSVPANITIIGTMNTADRSLTTLDAALRRRFTFEAVMPDSTLLNDLFIEGVSIQTLFERINQRLAWVLDDDHQLGHSYFLALKQCATDEEKLQKLGDIFINSIIPQLNEYFFDDATKTAFVLNDYGHERLFVTQDTSRLFGGHLPLGLSNSRLVLQPAALFNLDTYRQMAR